MKKILIASCFYDLAQKINSHCQMAEIEVDLTVVNTTDDLLHALSQQQYNALFSEYALADIDIWKMSSLIHSTRFLQATCAIVPDSGNLRN